MALYLVTGASGAVGAHLAKALLDRGDEVVSVLHDLKPTDTSSLLGIRNRITWVPGDLCDESFVKRLVADYSPVSIFHLAALPLVQVATRTTIPIFSTNIGATVNLLEAVKENAWAKNPIRFVLLDSDKAYGDAGKRPYTEDMMLNALAIYDVSKACAGMICRAYARQELVPKLVIARACNIIAPGDLNFGRLLPRTILPCLRGDRPTLYRTDYLREYIYVEDAVKGLLHLDQGLAEGRFVANNAIPVHGEVFNLGTGEQRSLDSVVNEVLQQFPGIEPTWTGAPPLSRVEIPFQKLDTTKIRKTGWQPTHTVTEAIKQTVTWWQRNFEKLPRHLQQKKVEGWHG